MKKKISLIAFILLCSSYCFSQTDSVQKKPKMVLATPNISFGTIERGSDPIRKLVIKNEGEAALIISGVGVSCGCTVTTWPKEPILPGATGEIQVRYNTNLIGLINRTITISSNCPDGTKVVRLTGEVIEKKKEEVKQVQVKQTEVKKQ